MVASGVGAGMKLPALIFTRAGSESARTLYLISMLRAKGTEVDFYHIQSSEIPDDVARAYEFDTPFFVDRGLVAYGAALDELVHERYPGPSFMPVLPTQRAQMRMLVSDIQRWYKLSTEDLIPKLLEASESYHGPHYFLSRDPSAVDWALVPLLERAAILDVEWSAGFKLYIRRMLSHPAVLEARGILNNG